jgi:hypothetical protein
VCCFLFAEKFSPFLRGLTFLRFSEQDEDAEAESDEDRDKKRKPKQKSRQRRMYRDIRQPFILELDDETDEDIMTVLMEKQVPLAMSITNTETVPGEVAAPVGPGNLLVAIKRVKWVESQRAVRLNRFIASIFHDIYLRLLFQVRDRCSYAALLRHLQTFLHIAYSFLVGLFVGFRHGSTLLASWLPCRTASHSLSRRSSSSSRLCKRYPLRRRLDRHLPSQRPYRHCFPTRSSPLHSTLRCTSRTRCRCPS